MKTITNINNIYEITEPSAVALGTFDGMHIGHQHVIKKMVAHSKKEGLKSMVYTFSNHPKDLHPTDDTPKRLMTPSQKMAMIASLGVDYLIQVPFDDYQVNISAEDFIKKILVDQLLVKHVCIGFDFRFGKNASGNKDLLMEKSRIYDYSLEIVEPISVDNSVVSSTLIRQHLLNGQVMKANALLGRPYCVEGHVVDGKKMGRKLGFPTANLKTEYEMSVLKPGVYISEVDLNGTLYPSLTNVGFNPTFDQEHFTIETYIMDFDEDIYGQHLRVSFLSYMRPEIRFKNLDELIDQIHADLLLARKHFESII